MLKLYSPDLVEDESELISTGSLTMYDQTVSRISEVKKEQVIPIGQNQADRILDWLRQFGFTYNPFQQRNSELDSNLSEHFVDPQNFEAMLEPKDQAIFARIGDGKTATRLRLQTYYRDSFSDKKIFAFSYLISQDLSDKLPTTLLQHLDAILTSAVRHAFVLLALRGINLPVLQDEKSALPLAHEFVAYFDRYYGLLDTWQTDLDQAISDHSLRQAVNNLAPIYDDLESQESVGTVNTVWLKRWQEFLSKAIQQKAFRLPIDTLERWLAFQDLLERIGIEKILILVDSVDVKPNPVSLIHTGGVASIFHSDERLLATRLMVNMIRPLLNASVQHTLGNKTTWKFFLPLELYMPFSAILSKQLFHVIVAWDDARLRKLLENRIRAASNDVVSTLLQLIEDDVPDDLETYLIVQSGLSPRYLIHLISKILEAHVGQSGSDELPGKLTSDSLARIEYFSHTPT